MKKQKTHGRPGRVGRVNKVGQAWRSSFVLACLISSHEEIRVAKGPLQCTCHKPGNVIAYNKHLIPICLACGLSYEDPDAPRKKSREGPDGSRKKSPRNRLKSAKRYLKRISY